ncbi:MAG: lipoate--protein ligase family protein [Cyanobacteria bacterium P01_A01_bin.123]
MRSESSHPWRLLPPIKAPGAVQMAVDQWLLAQHCQDRQPNCLRFYTWSPAAISLGYHQRRWPNEWHQMVAGDQPLDLVRRPTGGRAVLHQGDLTYSVITSAFQGRRIEVYQAICQFLIDGWATLGIPLTYGHQQRGYEKTDNCFSSPTAADLVMTDGYKLIGSAQVKREGRRTSEKARSPLSANHTVLQHGSMRLHPDVALHQKIFAEPLVIPNFPERLQSLSANALNQTVIDALTVAANHCFSTTWIVQPLSEDELHQAIACFGNQPLV